MSPISPVVPMVALLAGVLLTGCTEPQTTATPAPPVSEATQAASHPDVFRFRIGALEAAALKDGDIDAANDGKTFGVGQPTDQVGAVLTAAGQPADVLHLSIQPLLVRSGTRILLFDTGAADASFARAGRLPAGTRYASRLGSPNRSR